jgi:hypothetical protein
MAADRNVEFILTRDLPIDRSIQLTAAPTHGRGPHKLILPFPSLSSVITSLSSLLHLCDLSTTRTDSRRRQGSQAAAHNDFLRAVIPAPAVEERRTHRGPRAGSRRPRSAAAGGRRAPLSRSRWTRSAPASPGNLTRAGSPQPHGATASPIGVGAGEASSPAKVSAG